MSPTLLANSVQWSQIVGRMRVLLHTHMSCTRKADRARVTGLINSIKFFFTFFVTPFILLLKLLYFMHSCYIMCYYNVNFFFLILWIIQRRVLYIYSRIFLGFKIFISCVSVYINYITDSTIIHSGDLYTANLRSRINT